MRQPGILGKIIEPLLYALFSCKVFQITCVIIPPPNISLVWINQLLKIRLHSIVQITELENALGLSVDFALVLIMYLFCFFLIVYSIRKQRILFFFWVLEIHTYICIYININTSFCSDFHQCRQTSWFLSDTSHRQCGCPIGNSHFLIIFLQF